MLLLVRAASDKGTVWNRRRWATFKGVKKVLAAEPSWIADSVIYGTLRSLKSRGYIAILHTLVGGGQGEWPIREWQYRLTDKGRRAVRGQRR
jgi:hypothetical protein